MHQKRVGKTTCGIGFYLHNKFHNILNISKSIFYAICNLFYCVIRYSSRKSMKIVYIFKQSMERQDSKLNNLSKLNEESIELKDAKSPTKNEFNQPRPLLSISLRINNHYNLYNIRLKCKECIKLAMGFIHQKMCFIKRKLKSRAVIIFIYVRNVTHCR